MALSVYYDSPHPRILSMADERLYLRQYLSVGSGSAFDFTHDIDDHYRKGTAADSTSICRRLEYQCMFLSCRKVFNLCLCFRIGISIIIAESTIDGISLFSMDRCLPLMIRAAIQRILRVCPINQVLFRWNIFFKS